MKTNDLNDKPLRFTIASHTKNYVENFYSPKTSPFKYYSFKTNTTDYSPISYEKDLSKTTDCRTKDHPKGVRISIENNIDNSYLSNSIMKRYP